MTGLDLDQGALKEEIEQAAQEIIAMVELPKSNQKRFICQDA